MGRRWRGEGEEGQGGRGDRGNSQGEGKGTRAKGRVVGSFVVGNVWEIADCGW